MSISFTYLDHSEERSSVVFQLPDIDGTSFDDILGEDPGDSRADLQAALNGVTRGTLIKVRADALDVTVSGSAPTDPDAQREDGLRVWARGDVSTRLYSWTIPTADRATLAVPGSDDVPLTGTEMAALVAAIEAHVKPRLSPSVTEDVTVVRARIIGRNN